MGARSGSHALQAPPVALPVVSTTSALVSWLTTVDHKRIGILYGSTAFAFFLLGGVEALLIRLQLAVPNNTVVSAHTFNALFTMHGTTMIFFVVMPLVFGFANYLVPLMIGARDMAFPRLNAFSFWMTAWGGLFFTAVSSAATVFTEAAALRMWAGSPTRR